MRLQIDYLTSIPKLFAVPMIESIIESILLVFITGFLISAISKRSALLNVAIFFLFGSALPIFCCAFQSNKCDVKGGRISRSYVLSQYTVITAGTLTSYPPNLAAISLVLSLNSLMNAPIFTPF